jgi:ribonuclease HII
MRLPDFEFEKSLLPPNCRYLLGIDEVGRGPLAGPVTIGAFILDLKSFDPQEFINLKVTDSKKLTASKRQHIASYFKNKYSFKTLSLSSSEIDRQGIAVCIYNLIQSAMQIYRSTFDFCLIDGNYNKVPLVKEGFREIETVIRGDAKCFSIAAASIVAKVDRDNQMNSYDLQYPNYGFISHKGYGTKKHIAAITTFGPCPIHRLSFKPLSTYLKHKNTGSHG